MIDYRLLEQLGTTEERLQAVFTAGSGDLNEHGKALFREKVQMLREERSAKEGVPVQADEEGEPQIIGSQHDLKPKELKRLYRETVDDLDMWHGKWEKKIQSRLDEALDYNMRNYRFYAAVDMAWDGPPMVPEALPLTLWAQGKIQFSDCLSELEDTIGPERAKAFISTTKDEKTGKSMKSLNLPRFYEFQMSLVRPYVRRRVAAQANKYNNLYPYMRYQSRSNSQVGKLRADVTSQRVEMMSDDYGYRHNFTQSVRRMCIYGWECAFVDGAWDSEEQFRANELADGEVEAEEVTVREGVDWTSPHPSRVGWNLAHPLSSINTDTGVDWITYWDVKRAYQVMEDERYWNRDSMKFSSRQNLTYIKNKTYYELYYPGASLKFPSPADTDYSQQNERKSHVGTLSRSDRDASVFLYEYFEKFIPKEWGLGDYPYPVWGRFVVVNDRTVVFAEILPSRPAAYMGYDQNDSKVLSQSMAHEIMPYQDQVTNLFSQYLYMLKISSFLIFAVNTDMLDDDIIDALQKHIEGNNYYNTAAMVPFGAAQVKKILGNNPGKAFEILQTSITSKLTELMSSIKDTIQFLEKNQMMSPQELGQFTQRETTASEVNEVSQTATALSGFISEGPDEFRAAMKQICYEALVAKSSNEVYVPVVDTYTDETIKNAGFKPVREESVGEQAEATVEDNRVQNVIGSTRDLVHNYIFNSRDGSERQISSEVAKILVQLIQFVFNFEPLARVAKPTQLMEMVNEVFRLTGSGFIMKLGAEQGNEFPESDLEQVVKAFQGEVQKLAQQVGLNQQQIAGLDASIKEIGDAIIEEREEGGGEDLRLTG